MDMAVHGGGGHSSRSAVSRPDPAAARAALLSAIGAVLLIFSNQQLLHFDTWGFGVRWPDGNGLWSAVVTHWSPLAAVVLALMLRLRRLQAARSFAGTALLVLGVFGFAAFIDLFWWIGPSTDLELNLGLTLSLLAALSILAAGVIASVGTMSDPVVRPRARRSEYLVRAAFVLIFISVLSGITVGLFEGNSLSALVADAGPYLVYPFTLWMFSRCLPRLAPAPAAGALICLAVLTGLPQIYWLADDAELFQFSFAALMYIDAKLLAALLLLAASLPLVVLGRQPTAGEARDGLGKPDTGSDPEAGGLADPTGAVVDVRDSIDVRDSALRSDPEPTRHLCLALHLNDDLLRQATREVIDSPDRGIAPSFGIDLGTVVRHALLARRRMWLRDALLTALALQLFPQLLVLLFSQNGTLLIPIAVTTLSGWLVVTADRVSRDRIVSRQLSPEGFERHRQPRLTPAEERKILALQALDRGNVTAYGGYFPFVGSGSPIGGWSFALSVLKGREGIDGVRQAPHPFELAELYEAVRLEVEKLGIEGVHVEDRLYVDGEQAARDPRFRTTSSPAQLIDSVTVDELDHLVRTPERINRVYRCLRIHGWGGEYVLSIYLNFTRTGRGLFAETRYFLLLPTKDEDRGDARSAGRGGRTGRNARGRSATAVGRAGSWQFASAARRSLSKSVPALFRAVPSTFGDLRDLSRRSDGEPNIWGATTSLRELAQSRQYRRYFQQIDREMTSKIVERQLLDTITEFLRDRNIDTFEIEERQTAILNNGVIVSGGTLNADSLAVGANSQSLLSRVSAAIKSPTEERSPS
jgi:hypothetical protein